MEIESKTMPKNMSHELKVISRELSANFSFVRFDVPLRDYSAVKVGGPAWALAEPETLQQLIKIFKFA